ncbi:hypothetical protein EVA_01798 [gut metagenome]|uniref:Uncharacterized protein n=1 Tax=gut metagenome TaxID=749906 RepID=J9GPG9_9ZZZZ
MSHAGFHFHQFRIFFTGRPISYFMFIIHCDGVVWIQTCYTSVFHENTRYTVNCSRNDEFIIKSYVLCIRAYLAVEICSSFGA